MKVDSLVLGLSLQTFMYYKEHVLEGSLSADISGKHLCDDPRTLPKPIEGEGKKLLSRYVV